MRTRDTLPWMGYGSGVRLSSKTFMRSRLTRTIAWWITSGAAVVLAPSIAEAGPIQLFAQGEAGYSFAHVSSVASEGRLVPTLNTVEGHGYGFGLTAGVRLFFIDVALHGHVSRLDSAPSADAPLSRGFDLGQVQLLAQLHAPLPFIDPYLRLGFGYAWLGNPPLAEIADRSFSNPNGWSPTIGLGADVWLGSWVTLGAGVDFSGFFLHRPGSMGSMSCSGNATCDELTKDGNGAGYMLNAQVRLGLHL
jgi:hypothetical protein